VEPWDSIAADRSSLADYLETLEPDDWEATSWCPPWTVKGVATHLLVTSTMSKGKVFFSFLGSGFNLDKMSAKLIAQMTADLSNDEVIALMRSSAGSQSAPPGLKPVGVLTEVLVHAGDISLALDKPLDLPAAHYVTALDHMKDVQPVLGCKKRIEGLTMRATDADWSTGEGPVVEGDVKHLASAIAGRRGAIDDLSGDGVAIMRER
jgi:uncharacterized protein (TIGR03083 family)